MRILVFSGNIYEENAYLIKREDDVTLIDPGFNFDAISSFLKENSLSPGRILLTHGHIDHFGETDKFYKEFGPIPTYIHEVDVPLLTDPLLNCADSMSKDIKILKGIKNVNPVEDGSEISEFIFHLTPGHTKGSTVIEFKEMLFTGDTLFKGSVGRTDLPTGSLNEMNHSLKYLSTSFSKATVILPGHFEKTDLKNELKNNRFLQGIMHRG